VCSLRGARILLAVLLFSVPGAYPQQPLPSGDGVTIHGSVLDPRGNPVIGATVKLESERGSVEATTDAAGLYQFSALQIGSYLLDATKSGSRSPAIAVVAAAKGEDKKVDLTLTDSGLNTARVYGSSKPAGQGGMEFSDEPSFAIAGVTDWTAVGGHGSDTSLRTSEDLARETLTLKPEEATRATAVDANQQSADMHREAGETDEKHGDPLGAVREFEQAAHLDPSEQNYFEWGSELLLHRAVWQAQEVFQKGAQAFPGSARMLTGLGSALFAGARYDEAAESLCKASDLNPKDPEPYIFMGKIQAAAPNPLVCIVKRLARFAEENQGNSAANYLYAMAVLKDQERSANPHGIEQAKMLLTKAVTIDSKCADAYLQLGILAASDRNSESAIDYYAKAIAANPELGDAHYRLGVAYDRIGQREKAKAEFALHDRIEKEQADEVERQRREIKQFLISTPGQTKDAPPK
jgi:tetratricopeptide (TPR) repeat protein